MHPQTVRECEELNNNQKLFSGSLPIFKQTQMPHWEHSMDIQNPFVFYYSSLQTYLNNTALMVLPETVSK